MNNKVMPEIILERFLLNELDERQMGEVGDLIASDPALRSRIEGMARSGKEILESYPPETMVPRIIELAKQENVHFEKTPAKKISTWKDMVTVRVVPALAAAMIIAGMTIIGILNYRPGELARTTDGTEVTRAKGLHPGLYLYRKRGSSVESLGQGSVAAESDLIQLAYVSGENDHGLIFSVDGNGTVTLQYPDGLSSSTKITTGKRVFLHSSYELDDAPGFEKFVFITSPEEIDIDNVLKNAQKNARGAASDNALFALPGSGQRQYVFLLKKKESR